MDLMRTKTRRDDPFMDGRVALICILLAGPVVWTFSQWEKEQQAGTASAVHEHAFKKINATLQQASATANDTSTAMRASLPPAGVIVTGQSMDTCMKLTGGMIDERFKRCISTYTVSGLR
jgi:hypothetical protein